MLPHSHLLGGVFLSSLSCRLGIIDGPQAVLLTGLTVAVDADHYLTYVIRKKDFHPFRCWNASINREEHAGRSLFHNYQGILLTAPLFILGLVWRFPWGYAAWCAYLLHLVMDRFPEGILPRLSFGFKGLRFRISYMEIIVDLLVAAGLVWLLH